MANTYSQLYVHFVFSVQNRACLLSTDWRDRLFRYICGIVNNLGNKCLAVNGTADHVHLFIGKKPTQSEAGIIQLVKKESAIWINLNHLTKGNFHWQTGYGVFTYSHSQIDNVIKYIINQESHHKKITFKEEYLELLKLFNIEFKNEYLFEWID